MTLLNPSAKTAVLVALLSSVGHSNAQTVEGGISGKLITESGQPLAGVTAVYRKSIIYVADAHFHMKPAPGEVGTVGTVTTRADGTFSASLPAGSYALCLDSPPNGYVDHCAWSLTPAYFTVSAGASTTMAPVTVIAGVRVHFLVSDPQAALPAAGKLEPVATIGVTTARGAYKPATINTRSTGVIELIVTVPHNLSVSTYLFSRTLKFTSPSGALASVAPISIPQAAADTSISFNVSK